MFVLLTIGGPIVLATVGPRIGRPRLLAHVALAAVVGIAAFFLGELVVVAIALVSKAERDVADRVAQVGGVLFAVGALWLTFRRRTFGSTSTRPPKRPARSRHQPPLASKAGKEARDAGTCARCAGALARFRKDNGAEKSVPRDAIRFCTACGALLIDATHRLSSPWLFRVSEQARFEARSPPASDLRTGFRRLGIAGNVVLVLAAVGQFADTPARAGKTLASAFFLWLVTPGRARELLVTIQVGPNHEDLVIEDTVGGPVTLDSRSMTELWVRAKAGEYGSQFDLVATLKETSETVRLVGNLSATDALDLAEHLAACLQLPVSTRLPRHAA